MQETNNVKTFVGIDAHARQCSIKGYSVKDCDVPEDCDDGNIDVSCLSWKWRVPPSD